MRTAQLTPHTAAAVERALSADAYAPAFRRSAAGRPAALGGRANVAATFGAVVLQALAEGRALDTDTLSALAAESFTAAGYPLAPAAPSNP